MKKIALLGVTALLCLWIKAQSTIKPLNIGDTLPDINLSNLFNYSKKTAKISSFKGKLLILDFWATWCGSCIKKLPELERLQSRFEDKVTILLVDSDTLVDDEQKVRAFFKQWEKRSGKSFTLTHLLARDNPLLLSLFPHKSVPHMVWIDSYGKVVQITAASYLTDEYISKAINNEPFLAVIKKDLVDIDKKRPLSVGQSPEIESKVLFRSAFYNYMGLGSGGSFIIDSASNTITRRSLNQPILKLYQKAFPMLEGSFLRRLVLEVKDSTPFFQGTQQQARWMEANSYSYEITTSATLPEIRIKQWMLADLNNFFNLTSRDEKRLTTAWELYITNANLIKTKGGKHVNSLDIEKPGIILQNAPMDRLTDFLNVYVKTNPMVPIVDVTGYGEHIDIDVSIPDGANLQKMQDLLAPYGLGIRPVKKEMIMHVISDHK